MRMRWNGALATVAVPVLVALAASEAAAQQPTRRPARRSQPIEIRGQVPTPQVVTVRPREVPAYSRAVLVPAFYDHDFWPMILPGYQIVARRLVTGNTRLDSLATQMQADSVQRSDSLHARAAIGSGLLNAPRLPVRTPPRMITVPGDTTRRTMPMTPGDSTRSSGGTPPATSPR